MNRRPTRASLIAALVFGAPLLVGAHGHGCTKVPATTPMGNADGSASCEAKQGEHCGGNIAHACRCVAGLVCTPAASGPAFGDVGGTCEPAVSGGTGASGQAAANVSGAGGSAMPGGAGSPANAGGAPVVAGHVSDAGQPVPVDAGSCVSQQDEHCGGNTTHPCSCASGLVCTPKLGGPAPGDVGGTCQPEPAADGGVCVAQAGEHCAGNIRQPCSCAAGLACTPAAAGPPAGDVGGTCQAITHAAACARDADCRLEADYCTGCDCVALAPGQSVKACSGPGVRCFADPCGTKQAACQDHACVVR